MNDPLLSRRQILQSSAIAALSAGTCPAMSPLVNSTTQQQLTEQPSFALKYLVGSCMYGYLYLGEILPEIARCGSSAIDIWPKRHGNQREQWQDFGDDLFAELLGRHHVTVGCITQYKLGPFALAEEMKLAQKFGCQTIVTGGVGPKGLLGAELKSAVQDFLERMKPHLEVAEATNVTIAIENHANNLFESADSLRYLAELRPSKHLAVALAPYHLPQDPQLLAALIRELGPALAVFYAWQHGDGCMVRLPKEQELLQMPGRGSLDFQPLLQALKDIQFAGWTEIFMHPVPRGIPILETAEEVTAEINRARNYLETSLQAVLEN